MQPTQPRSPQKIQGQDSINQLEEQAFASSLQGRSVSSGNGGSVSSNFVPKLFQATVQPPSGDSTLVAIEQLDESLDIASCRFPGLVSQSGAERSSQTVRSLKEVLPTILEGLYGDADEEQLRQEASAWGRSSATLCRYGYFLVLHEQTQDSTVALLKQAVDCREDKAWITYRPTKHDASRDFSSFISDDMITANASCLAALLLSYIFLQKGEFQKSYDWNLTVEQSAKQQPSAVHIFLRDALKKELTQAVSGTISSELQRACKGSISIVGRSLGGSSSSRDRPSPIISEAQDFFSMLGDWLAPEQQFPKDALLFIQQQISQLEAVIGDLDVNVQNQALKQLEPFYLLYGPLLKQAENGKEKNTGLVNHLLHLATYHAGEQALRADKPDVARGLFAHLMTQVHKCDNQLVERSALQLGQIYLDKGTKEDFIKAAGLFNYAHNLVKKIEPRSPAEQHRLASFTDQCLEKIASAQTLMIQLCKGVCCPSTENLKLHDVDNRKLLSEIRASATARIAEDQSEPRETQALFAKIAQDMKSLVAQLFQQCLDVYGPPPCQFAMITLGSLARHEATPWSDLEFAFLIEEEKDSPEVIEYFVNITYLMHLKVINLGETILPALSIPDLKIGNFYDDVTPRGFAFDGGGVAGKGHKTPLGQDEQTIEGHIVAHEFRLIQTPSQMAQFQGTSQKYDGAYWFELEPHLPLELLNIDFAHGNSELVDIYREALQAALSAPYEKKPIREHLAFNLLAEEDLIHFDPWSQTQLSNAGCLLRIKNDLYRLPHLALDRFALFSSIFIPSSWEKIEALAQKEVLNLEGARSLQSLLSETMRFRLTAHCKASRQQEELNPVLNPFVSDDPVLILHYLDLDPGSVDTLMGVYKILLPLYYSLERFIKHKDCSVLREQKFLMSDEKSLGRIAMRLQLHERAKSHFQRAPESVEVLFYLGRIAELQAEFEEAEKRFLAVKKQLLSDNQSGFGAEMDKMSITVFLAGLYRKTGEVKKAKEVLDEYKGLRTFHIEKLSVLEEAQWQETEQTLINERALLCLELGKEEEAIFAFENLLSLSKDAKNKAAVLSNLGLALSRRDRSKSTRLYQEAFELNQSAYPLGHISQAQLLNNLGRSFYEKDAKQEALAYYLRGLRVAEQLEFPHEVNVLLLLGLGEIFTCFSQFEQVDNNLRQALLLLGLDEAHTCFPQFEQAENSLCQVLPRARGVFPNGLRLGCDLLYRLGSNYAAWGKEDKAEEYFGHFVAASQELEQRSVDESLIADLCNTTQVLIESGKLEMAYKCSKCAIRLLEVLGSVNAELCIQTLQIRGEVLAGLGRASDALLLYKRSQEKLKEYVENFKINSFSVVAAIRIGDGFTEAGSCQKAIEVLEPLIQFQWCGQAPDNLIGVLRCLARAYTARAANKKQLEDYQKALSCYEQMLRICADQLGAPPPEMMRHLSDKADCLVSLGRLKDAEECIVQARKLASSGEGSTLIDLYHITSQLVQILYFRKDVSRETACLLQLLKLSKKLFGDTNRRSIGTCARLAAVYSEQSDWNKVLQYSCLALDYYRASKEPNQYFGLMGLVIDAYSNLGGLLEVKKCCEQFIAAYDLFSLIEDDDYLSISLKLVDLCMATDSEAEAVSYCQQILDVCNDLSNGEEKEQALQCYADLLGLMPQLEATKELRLKILSGLGLLQQELGQVAASSGSGRADFVSGTVSVVQTPGTC